MRLISTFFLIIALAIALISCEPVEPISLDECIELSGRQETPLTLTNHVEDRNVADYCIDGNFQIVSDVVVEPGVTILMKDGAKIHVMTGGSF
ncbi:MAG: hypothetical protein AAFN10_25895, partial [Bacteroidota bacterium]